MTYIKIIMCDDMHWQQGKFAFILDNFDNVEEIMIL